MTYVKHLDLFSGIGGFALAADQVWDKVEHTFVEIDPFCRAVLKKHWPNSYIHGDIKTFTNTTSERRQGEGFISKGQPGQSNRSRENQKPFLLTGGFPCQGFSQAGKRRGTNDDRYLWPEMLRVIQLTKPDWVIAENVYGLVTWNEGMVLEQVCTELESEGYEVWPLIIPAVAVNAPHRRDRVWIIGHTKHSGLNGSQDREGGVEGSERDPQGQNQLLQSARSAVSRETVDWDTDWREVAAATCIHGLYDGLSFDMDGTTISGSRYRREALKAHGNSIVPAVAIQIMQAIKSTYDH